MKRQSSYMAPADDGHHGRQISNERAHLVGATSSERKRTDQITTAVVLLGILFLVAVVGLLAALATEEAKRHNVQELSRQEALARLVVERMRENNFFAKQDCESVCKGPERHVPTGSKTQSIDEDRTEEFRMRLDRLESLVQRLSETRDGAESLPSKSAPIEVGGQPERVNLRLDRIEALLSQLFEEVSHPERTKASLAHEQPTRTDGAADRKKPPTWAIVTVFVMFAGLCAAHPYLVKQAEAKKAAKRRQLVEAVAERLAVSSGADSRSPGGGKKSASEDEDDVSFENLELSVEGTQH